MLVVMVFVALMVLVMTFIMSYSFSLVDDSFNQIDFTIANKSFNETYHQTLGKGVNSMKSTVPQSMSIGIILGMIIVMLLIGYFFAEIDALWIILDIGIIIIAEIAGFIVSTSFLDFINSNPSFLAVYEGTLNAGSQFVLLLPMEIPIIGVLIMITTYIFNKNRNEKGESLSLFG